VELRFIKNRRRNLRIDDCNEWRELVKRRKDARHDKGVVVSSGRQNYARTAGISPNVSNGLEGRARNGYNESVRASANHAIYVPHRVYKHRRVSFAPSDTWTDRRSSKTRRNSVVDRLARKSFNINLSTVGATRPRRRQQMAELASSLVIRYVENTRNFGRPIVGAKAGRNPGTNVVRGRFITFRRRSRRYSPADVVSVRRNVRIMCCLRVCYAAIAFPFVRIVSDAATRQVGQ